ncbi:threonine dehydratase [Hyphomicrobium nitrativorans NL23]|uniref:Threonine dehydratase n=1 Tax=Hyphomicrobium nitrativorans NL23 TaxID=1029756 RepID=V5SDE3_9HYPH|nr:threonine ammonia-lyase [Hyphomicrobium nitrativorans]AHB48886.1 threonine dehydratase [Hyphomicrobium nitrativorans NL23]
MADQTPETLPTVTLADIERAARVIEGAVVRTPCDRSHTLSHDLGADIWFKFENLQFTSSYKERGALVKLSSLSEEERKRGVIAMSAGNHAQGVSYHAGRLGIPATIVMPEGTPAVKAENTRRWGAHVILKGKTLEEAAEFAHAYREEHGLVFVHPYNDPLVIAGQGTVALEMLEAVPDLDALIVPVGGSGLIAGMATAAKAIKPGIEVIGVEAALYPSLYNKVKGTHLPTRGDTLAEGIAVAQPGPIPGAIAAALVDDVVLVSETDLERATFALLMIEKTVVEGAGAAGLAAIMADRERWKGRKVGLPLTGGNIDPRLLASVLTRELAREGRLSRLTIDIPDRPGELSRVSGLVGQAGANIVEVYHQRVFTDLPARGTELNLVIETRDRTQLQAVLTQLEAAGYRVLVKAAQAGA